MDHLKRPLLVEGEAGVGKTEIAKALAFVHGAELVRLQCYEGLDASAALYEWNYQRQIIAIKAREGSGESPEAIEARIFSEAYLLERPLLAAIRRGTLAGPADRRGRPRRRGVRGFPARTPVRLSDHHSGISEPLKAIFDPARRAHLQRHARTFRRAAGGAASTTISISPTSTARRRSSIRRPGIDTAFALQVARMVGGTAQGGTAQDAGRRREPRLGGDARGARRHDLDAEPEIVHATLIAC